MAAVSRRPHPRHNFPMPSLKWGNQRHLRCMKLSSEKEFPSLDLPPSFSPPDFQGSLVGIGSFHAFASAYSSPAENNPQLSSESDDGVKKVREKLLVDIHAVATHYKERNRSSCDAETDQSGGGGLRGVVEETKSDAPRFPSRSRPKSLRLRGFAPPEREREKMKEIPRFSIALSRKEIEQDFLAITGSKPRRRPKKRAKSVQNKLDETFPGLWLCNVTPDSYRILDHLEQEKR